MIWMWALVGCGLIRGGGGTAVGNPGMASMRLAEQDGGWRSAKAATAAMVLTRCDGWEESVVLEAVDLLAGPLFEVPGGPLCGLRIELTEVVAAGAEPLDLQEATVHLAPGDLRFDRASWVIELGEPGLATALADRSGVYRDLVPDGQIDPVERARGSAAQGSDRTGDDAEPPVLIAVGVEGFRAAIAGPPWPAHLFEDEFLPLQGVAYQAGRWVVVGGDDGGLVGTSLDQGASWTLEASTIPFSSVVAADGQFFASAFDGSVHASADGLAWDLVAHEGVVWRAIAASSSEIVAVGDGFALVSTDGSDWQLEALTGAPRLYALAQGPSGFMAVGDTGERWFRPEGGAWLQKATGGGKLYNVVWSGEQFVAVGDGDTWTSSDGDTWDKRPVLAFDAMVRHDGALIGVRDGVFERSIDHGDSWSPWITVEGGGILQVGTNRP